MSVEDEDDRGPELGGVIEGALEALLARMPRAMPAKVVKWDAGKQRANCQILVKVPYVDEEGKRQTESVAVIPGVPIMFPGAGGFRLTCPISDGTLTIEGSKVPATTGLLIWCDRSLDKWLSGSGAEVDPEADHQAGLQDAIFIPGLNPFGAALSNVPTDTMTIGSDSDANGRIAFKKGEVQLGAGATKGVARKDDPAGGGTIAFTFGAGSGAATLVVLYTPGDGSTPQNLAAGTGTLNLKEKITNASAVIKAAD